MDAVATVTAAYKAFVGHDLIAMLDGVADDVVLHVQGPQPLAGDHAGRDTVQRLLVDEFGPVLKDLEAEVVHLHEERPGHVVVVISLEGRVAGEHFASKSLHVHRVVDGRVVEMWFQPYDEDTTRRFWEAIDADPERSSPE